MDGARCSRSPRRRTALARRTGLPCRHRPVFAATGRARRRPARDRDRRRRRLRDGSPRHELALDDGVCSRGVRDAGATRSARERSDRCSSPTPTAWSSPPEPHPSGLGHYFLARLAAALGDHRAADELYTDAAQRDERAGAKIWVVRDQWRHEAPPRSTRRHGPRAAAARTRLRRSEGMRPGTNSRAACCTAIRCRRITQASDQHQLRTERNLPHGPCFRRATCIARSAPPGPCNARGPSRKADRKLLSQ